MPQAVDYSGGISRAWANVATFVPKLVVFLIILIVGYLIARIIARILSRMLTRVGFDRLVEHGGIKTALSHSQYDASDILAKIVYYAIMLFVLSTAFGVFGTNPISSYLHAVIAYLPLVFVAIIIVVITAAIAAGARTLVRNSLGGLSYATVLANTAAGFILALGVIAALDQLHIAANVVNAVLYAALAAVVGIAIVAVGGGGIRTMSARWEAAAARYDAEKPSISAAVRQAPDVASQARQVRQQAEQRAPGDRQDGGAHSAPDPYRPGGTASY
jgi:Conserved TM helix